MSVRNAKRDNKLAVRRTINQAKILQGFVEGGPPGAVKAAALRTYKGVRGGSKETGELALEAALPVLALSLFGTVLAAPILNFAVPDLFGVGSKVSQGDLERCLKQRSVAINQIRSLGAPVDLGAVGGNILNPLVEILEAAKSTKAFTPRRLKRVRDLVPRAEENIRGLGYSGLTDPRLREPGLPGGSDAARKVRRLLAEVG